MIIVEITPENEKGPKLFPALSHDLFAVVNRGVCVSLTLHTLVDSCWRCQAINGHLSNLLTKAAVCFNTVVIHVNLLVETKDDPVECHSRKRCWV